MGGAGSDRLLGDAAAVVGASDGRVTGVRRAAGDEEHVLFACAKLGTTEWLASARECWRLASSAMGVTVEFPAAWVQEHRFQLAAAIIPTTVDGFIPANGGRRAKFVAKLHIALAERTAETMRRRVELMAERGRERGLPDAVAPES